MATELKKNVVRKCTNTSHKGRMLIVTLAPGDMIGMRQEGMRTTYWGSLESVFWVLAKQHAASVARQEAEDKRLKRDLRAEGLTE